MAWRQQLAIRVQDPNETTIQYADDIKTLLKKIDPNGDYPAKYRVRKFTKGLNPSIAFFVNRENPITLEAAITSAIQTEVGYNRTYNPLQQVHTVVPTPQNFGFPLPTTSVAPATNDVTKMIADLTAQVKQLSNNQKLSNWSNHPNNNNNNNNNNYQRRNNLTCDYYGKSGHEEKNCYHKRNTETRKQQNNNSSNNSQNKNCYTCGKSGHFAKDCPTKNGNAG